MRTLAEQAAAVAAREVSPVELVSEALHGIERAQPMLNAFTHVLADDALARAKEAEGADPKGPLHGVPIAIKELYDVEGLPTTGCCAAYADRIARSDAAVVEKLRAAGAIVVAKTNQHEMACGATNKLSSFGPVFNPWGEGRIPGGSSGGSGAAVSAGIVALAMGSDTGGSIRIPSSLCGVTGLKTTHGSVSLRGAMPLTPSLDTAGPLAASANDCRLVFEIIHGFDPDDVWSRQPAPGPSDRSVQGVRIAILDRFCGRAHPDSRAAVEAAARTFESLGAIVEEIEGPDPDESWSAVGPVFVTEFAACYPDLDKDERAHPEVRSLLEAGNSISGTVYANSVRACRAFSRHFESALARADVLIAPAAPYPAPLMEETEVDVGNGTINVHAGGPALFTMPVNVASLPALAFPVGFSPGGLPLGAQLIGPRWSELLLCSIVDAYQSATDWHLRRPDIAG